MKHAIYVVLISLILTGCKLDISSESEKKDFPCALPASSSTPGQPYQNQVEGVSEGDLLQLSAKYFYFVRATSIEIIERETLNTLKSIALEDLNIEKQWLLYQDQRLIYVEGRHNQTRVKVYDEKQNFKPVATFEIAGSTVDFRLVKSKLAVVTKIISETDDIFYSSDGCENSLALYAPPIPETQLTVVELTSSEGKIEVKNYNNIGFIDFIYLTESELFLFSNSGYPGAFFNVVEWTSGNLEIKQKQQYSGVLKDRFAIYKKNNVLMLTTTFYDNSLQQFNNKISVFEADYSKYYTKIAESPTFGLRENIRAIKYINDKAYVVTFERTDPLYVLNLKDPRNIRIISELKSPGFSTQLMQISNYQMLGFGFHATIVNREEILTGLKISLFDFADFEKPQELDTQLRGANGSYSEATYDHKALSVSSDKSRIIFPAVLVNDYRQEDFAGAIVMEIKNNQVNELTRMSHQKWRHFVCGDKFTYKRIIWNALYFSKDIQRTLQLGESIFSFSRFGVSQISALNFNEVRELQFENSSALCVD